MTGHDPKAETRDGQPLYTRCWQGVHASTAERLPAQLWKAMTSHDRSLWGYAVFELGLLDKVITAHRAQIASLEDERDEAREQLRQAGLLLNEIFATYTGDPFTTDHQRVRVSRATRQQVDGWRERARQALEG